MEKNTVLAVIFSTLVILGWIFLQPVLNPRPVQGPDSGAAGPASPVVPVTGETPVTAEGGETQGQPGISSAAGETAVETDQAEEETAPIIIAEPEQRIVIETELIRAVLTNVGGDIVSYRLKQHNDKGEPVEMIFHADENGVITESHAFTVAFGGLDAKPVQTTFRVSRPSPLIVEFSQEFSVAGNPGIFTLVKRYEFKNGEYMFQLAVSVNSPSGVSLDFNNAAYTISLGPQIGPRFQKLSNYYEYRQYYTLVNGKRNNVKVNTINDSRFTWAAVAGKYFTAIVIPDNTLYNLSFSDKAEPGIPIVSRMSLIRPSISNSVINDVYHFYLGPKNQENLGRYDTGDNGFKQRDLDFTKAASSSGFLTPLENLLKWLLSIFYKLVHNYGIAIILLTLLVKIVLFPLTKKSSEASFKMQALAPKIKEIQTKYKDNPAKMNAEMGAMYKKEGHNPVAGCLPMLIQLPLLFAMYNLFNNHFDLRGAMFIPGWIPDLSLPESVYDFSSPLPFLKWENLRLLPFIYVGSQLLYGLSTRTPEQQGNPTMKMMMYAMPLVFFFVLYNVPSGLLVFWIMSNLFTLVQQIILNKYLAQKKAAAAIIAENEPPPVIAPPRRKKKKK